MVDRHWMPQIDSHRCDGCGICVRDCPTQALGTRNGVAVVVQPDACHYCGICEANCPLYAIELPYLISSLGADESNRYILNDSKPFGRGVTDDQIE